ncbi:MAG TPA: hypothetical protein VMG81_02475 [Thermoplasmata archaeon]|nr:hypothetical protein [Thermoplasmata archaeon]
MLGLQDLALFYLIPIALWLTLLLIVCWIWWTKRLEDSLAYLVYLRERKVRFVSLIGALALTRIVAAVVNLASGIGWVSGLAVLVTGIVASVLGGILVFLFGWLLLWRGPAAVPHPLVLDVPEHLAYSLGVVDRTDRETDLPPR